MKTNYITCKKLNWVSDSRRGAARRMVAAHIQSFVRRMGPKAGFKVSEAKRLMRQAYQQVGYSTQN